MLPTLAKVVARYGVVTTSANRMVFYQTGLFAPLHVAPGVLVVCRNNCLKFIIPIRCSGEWSRG